MTDKEHWNEELLLQFYATLHISGYHKDIKTWTLHWMTGDVHHEATTQDLLELTNLPAPGDIYEPGCEAYNRAVESIFLKSEPNMTEMLTMMKPLPAEADCPKEFLVNDL
jgi:hypothetical protein